MRCPNCGKEIQGVAPFCSGCGFRFGNQQPNINQGPYGNQQPNINQGPYGNQQPYGNQGQYANQQQYDNRQPYGNGTPYNPQGGMPPKKSKGGIIALIVVGSVVAVSLIGLLIYLLVSHFASGRISEEDAKAMDGTWEFVAATIDDRKVAAKDTGTPMTFVFEKNGKAIYTLNGESEKYKWEKDGKLITIYVEEDGKEKGHTAILSDNYFTLTWNVNGKEMELIFAKQGTDATDPKKYVPENTIASSQTTPETTDGSSQIKKNTNTQNNTQNSGSSRDNCIGTWKATSGTASGQEVTNPEFLATFVLSGDGTASQTRYRKTASGIWQYEGGEVTIIIYDAEGSSYKGTINGNQMRLSGDDGQYDITMVLSKQ